MIDYCLLTCEYTRHKVTLLQIWSLRITNCFLITAPFAKLSVVTREHNINISHLHVHENVLCSFSYFEDTANGGTFLIHANYKTSLQSSPLSSDPIHGEQLKKFTSEIQSVLAVCDFKMPLVIFCVYCMKHTCRNDFLSQLAHKNIRISRLAEIFIYNVWTFNSRDLIRCKNLILTRNNTFWFPKPVTSNTQCSFQSM